MILNPDIVVAQAACFATWLLATDPETHALRKIEMEAKDVKKIIKLIQNVAQAVLGEVPESPVVQKVKC